MWLRAGSKAVATLILMLAGNAVSAQVGEDILATEPDETVAGIEALIDDSASPQGAMTIARSQVGEGDVSGAATTLERALINDPNSIETRVYYAALLCLLDDRQAADFEIGKLAAAVIADDGWDELERSCGPVARP